MGGQREGWLPDLMRLFEAVARIAGNHDYLHTLAELKDDVE